MSDQPLDEEWFARFERVVDVTLRERGHLPEGAVGDLQWLQMRCSNTRGYVGDVRSASIRELKRDVARFISDYPKLLPNDIVPND